MEEEKEMCERCGEEEATVHLTEFEDGEPVQKHLCENCYREEEDLPELSPSVVFSQLIEAVAPELKKLSSRQCPKCGTNYLEFRQTMKLGCPHDYEAFDEALEPLLERLHGSTTHAGKVPKSPEGAGECDEESLENRREALRRRLEMAIRKEDYENAARIRDQIQELDANGAGESKSNGG